MAEAIVSSQTVNITSLDSDKQESHRSHHSDATKPKVTTFHLYDPDVSTTILTGITLSSCQLNTEIDGFVETPDDNHPNSRGRPETEVYSVSMKMMCSLCNCQFTSRQQQTDHYKLDWHRFNLKQRIIGASPITEDNFEMISGDVSSISGSDSSTDNDSDNDSDRSPYSNMDKSGAQSPQSSNRSDKRDVTNQGVRGHRHPKVFFRSGDGQLISLQRCTLHGKKNVPSTQQELVDMATRLPMRMKWLVLMIGGGHFAGAVFDGKEIVSHKTFHRYTVRAKRGTAQGMRDSQQGGNQPKSAGASLRRYNEAALVEDIHSLLTSWDDHIKSCHRIFLRAPSYNKNAFFGGKSPPLDHRDDRIVTIPFATRRPTYKEIQRMHYLLTTIECYGDANEAEQRIVQLHFPKKINQQKNDSKKTSKDDVKVETKNKRIQKSSKARENNEEKTGDDSVDSGDDVELVLVEEEISTLDLQEFETRVKKPKRPKRQRKARRKPESVDDHGKPNSAVEALCEACRTGDWDRLKFLLVTLSNGGDEKIPEVAGHPSTEETKTTDCSIAKSFDNEEKRGVRNAPETTEVSGTGSEGTRLNPDREKKRNEADFAKNSSKTASVEKNASLKGHEDKVDVSSYKPQSSTESRDTSLQNATQQDFLQNENTSQEKSPDDNMSLLNTVVEERNMQRVEQGVMGNDPDIAVVVNRPVDEMGGTLIHVAVVAEQTTILWNLMEIGADPTIKNKKGHPPYVLCNNKEMRKEFRRFMATHPEKFDYEKSQIPSPLNSDLEELRAAKAAEKRRMQKKNKRLREKEEKQEQKKQDEEQKKQEKEDEEKRRFASLSDREKRALAAEKRLNAQLASQVSMATGTLSNIQRCWLCGNSLVSKVPFEYLDYKFCSIECVKKHKQQQKMSTTN